MARPSTRSVTAAVAVSVPLSLPLSLPLPLPLPLSLPLPLPPQRVGHSRSRSRSARNALNKACDALNVAPDSDTVVYAKRSLKRHQVAAMLDGLTPRMYVKYVVVLLWLTSKFSENQDDVQTVHNVATFIHRGVRSVCAMEIEVLDLLRWQVVRKWNVTVGGGTCHPRQL
jgi:hypothetical protein